MAKQATIRPILRTGKRYPNGGHPICISISKSGKAKFRIIQGLSCSQRYWSKDKNGVLPSHPKSSHYNEVIRQRLNDYIEAQEALIREGRTITPDRIIERAERSSEKITVLGFYDEFVQELSKRGDVSNSKHYHDIRKQFANFLEWLGKEDILFSDIDYNLLKKWEGYLKERGNKDTTLYAYIKNLRSLYNEASRRNYIAKDAENPFQTFKVSQFNRTTQKRVLTREEIRSIESIDVSEDRPALKEAKRYALFSYYVSGINLTDIALVEWKHKEGDYLKYKRKKTGKPIIAPLIDEAKAIIEEFKPYTADGPFIFPILDPEKHKTETQKKDRIQKVRSRSNKAIKEIARRAGIEDPEGITLYAFRHSFASHLREQGTDLWVIQKTLGHSNLEQTQNYLNELGGEELMEEVKKLGNEG